MGSGKAAATRRVTPVILCGGAGARLWPLSRAARPKQMLPLFDGRTMLQLTAARTADATLFDAPVVVTASAQAEDVAAQLCPEARLIAEPCGRSTAPAVALAALQASPETLLLVMPSDHLIAEPARFVEAVRSGLAAAEGGMLVVFGVRPSRPETGFGYIRRGKAAGDGLFDVERFVEKPDAATAARFLASGEYDWNAGIFLFTAGAYLDALARHAPDILEGVRDAAGDAAAPGHPSAPDAVLFGRVRAESVDRAVMERAANVAVVPMAVGWSDVGSWQALHAASARDGENNSLCGPVEALSARNCLIRSEGLPVVAIGVENLAIVVTEDAVLVVALDQSQRVGEAAVRLGAAKPAVRDAA